MGEPNSAILAETFIQYLEHRQINKILNEHHIRLLTTIDM
jgi:hypothetical protein